MEAVFSEARKHHEVAAQPDAKNRADADATKNAVVTGAETTPPADIGIGKAIAATGLLFAFVFALSLAAPFLAGMENAIGLLIIGFALW